MESLSPECTPLKQAYDSCFNSWFEGYLQPALDGVAASTPAAQPTSSAASSSNVSADIQQATSGAADGASPVLSGRRRIITNWSSSLGPRLRPTTTSPASPDSLSASDASSSSSSGGSGSGSFFGSQSTEAASSATSAALPPIDTRGKTRAQIKAEEYERNCGALWKNYQGCLKRAIAENTSLSTLLEAAREEHPLKDRSGLRGTAWDTNNEPNGVDQD